MKTTSIGPLTLFAPECAHGYLSEMQIGSITTNASSSTAWPAANRAMYFPFSVYETTIIDRVALLNGAAVAGSNFDVGIYDATTLAKLGSSGSTVQAGANVFQTTSIGDTILKPGCYLMGLALDNTAGTFFRYTVTNVQFFESWGIKEEASAFTLPATATPALLNTAYLPIFCVLRKGLQFGV